MKLLLDDDFKFLVIEPAALTVGQLSALKRELARYNLWGGIRLDIEATLLFTRILVRNSAAYSPTDDPIFPGLRDTTPDRVLAGLRLAYFKSLGTAAALMNDALLPLPDLFVLTDRESAQAFLRSGLKENFRL